MFATKQIGYFDNSIMFAAINSFCDSAQAVFTKIITPLKGLPLSIPDSIQFDMAELPKVK